MILNHCVGLCIHACMFVCMCALTPVSSWMTPAPQKAVPLTSSQMWRRWWWWRRWRNIWNQSHVGQMVRPLFPMQLLSSPHNTETPLGLDEMMRWQGEGQHCQYLVVVYLILYVSNITYITDIYFYLNTVFYLKGILT